MGASRKFWLWQGRGYPCFSTLLTAMELSFESEPALEMALFHYEQGAADYSDYLHLALAEKAQSQPFWTFDKAASKAPGAMLLT